MNINDGGPAYPVDGGPAFPVPVATPFGDGWLATGGMTLRDWFAGQVMVGLMSKLPLVDQTGALGVKVDDKIEHNRDIAESCYAIADAMLKAREAKP